MQMKTYYFPEDDILEMVFSNKEISREISQIGMLTLASPLTEV